MKQHAVFLANSGKHINVLKSADFRIGMLNGDQDRLGRDGFLQILRIHEPLRIHAKHCYAESVLFERPGAGKDRKILDGRHDDMVSLFPQGSGDAF